MIRGVWLIAACAACHRGDNVATPIHHVQYDAAEPHGPRDANVVGSELEQHWAGKFTPCLEHTEPHFGWRVTLDIAGDGKVEVAKVARFAAKSVAESVEDPCFAAALGDARFPGSAPANTRVDMIFDVLP